MWGPLGLTGGRGAQLSRGGEVEGGVRGVGKPGVGAAPGTADRRAETHVLLGPLARQRAADRPVLSPGLPVPLCLSPCSVSPENPSTLTV